MVKASCLAICKLFCMGEDFCGGDFILEWEITCVGGWENVIKIVFAGEGMTGVVFGFF